MFRANALLVAPEKEESSGPESSNEMKTTQERRPLRVKPSPKGKPSRESLRDRHENYVYTVQQFP